VETSATHPLERGARSQPLRFGRYRVEGLLGQGGAGAVYAGHDAELQRQVAIKVLLRGRKRSDVRDRLLREARAMAALSHPNIVVVHEVGSDRDHDFIVMELVDGGTLADWLHEPRPTADVIAAFLDAGRGLAHAHAHGLVHADFKPRNVLRASSGRVAVSDFGLVSEYRNELAVGSSPRIAIRGTPAYMAPEQREGAVATPASDQFAFCVSLWEALTGKRPDTRPGTQPGTLDVSRIPRALRPALLRGLERDPARRWPSIDVLLAQLAPRPRRRWPAVAAAAAIAAAGVVSAIAARTPSVADRCAERAKARNHIVRDALADVSKSEWIEHLVARPATCSRGQVPPHFAPLDGAQVPDALARYRDVVIRRDATATAAAFTFADASAEPCARAIALYAGLVGPHDADADTASARRDQARSAADACGDDQLRAVIALAAARDAMARPGADLAAETKRAALAVGRVQQKDLAAQLQVLQADVARHEGRASEGLASVDAAIDTFHHSHFEEAEREARALRAKLSVPQ
jgi:hypothetical protein